MIENNSCIDIGTDFANELGFTRDKFMGYLWYKDNYVTISFIESLNPSKGNLSKLFDRIQELGYGIYVPTPFARMRSIIEKKGFKQTAVPFAPEYGIHDLCEVWVKEPIIVDDKQLKERNQ